MDEYQVMFLVIASVVFWAVIIGIVVINISLAKNKGILAALILDLILLGAGFLFYKKYGENTDWKHLTFRTVTEKQVGSEESSIDTEDDGK